MKTPVTVILILTMGQIISHSQADFRIKLTKIKCNCTDQTFGTFEICRLKSVSRTLQYYQIYLKLHQLPITEAQFRFRFLKRANGYKPFLYDFTFNCDFLKHSSPVTNIIWSWFKEKTTLNHSCPIVGDIIMPRFENVYLQEKLNVLPIPDGEYAFHFFIFVDKKPVVHVEFYGVVPQ